MLATSSTKKKQLLFFFSRPLSDKKIYLLQYVGTWCADPPLCPKPSRNRVCFLFAWRATLCTFKPYGTYGYLVEKKKTAVVFFMSTSLWWKNILAGQYHHIVLGVYYVIGPMIDVFFRNHHHHVVHAVDAGDHSSDRTFRHIQTSTWVRNYLRTVYFFDTDTRIDSTMF